MAVRGMVLFSPSPSLLMTCGNRLIKCQHHELRQAVPDGYSAGWVSLGFLLLQRMSCSAVLWFNQDTLQMAALPLRLERSASPWATEFGAGIAPSCLMLHCETCPQPHLNCLPLAGRKFGSKP